ncbi:substrate-binding domain-containing protein [Streptomyces sp. NPDC052043]|uniref:substrate-binding domain-containing protein n=1 Tax=Streptomyces sp. NPDC052043 TaxID=3365684 RepID=UPI0037D42E51
MQAAYDSVARDWPSWRDAGVTALVCGSDLQAFGALAAPRDLGVGVPEEVSVAGSDHRPMSRIVQPSLTTVKLPSFELGSLGARELRRAMDGRDPVAGRPLVLPTRLEIRESNRQRAGKRAALTRTPRRGWVAVRRAHAGGGVRRARMAMSSWPSLGWWAARVRTKSSSGWSA